MGVDVSGLLPFAMLKPPRDQGEPHPVLSLIGGFSMMFAMKHREAVIKNGVITGTGDDASELMQAILDHPEGIYLCDPVNENNLDNLPWASRLLMQWGRFVETNMLWATAS